MSRGGVHTRAGPRLRLAVPIEHPRGDDEWISVDRDDRRTRHGPMLRPVRRTDGSSREFDVREQKIRILSPPTYLLAGGHGEDNGTAADFDDQPQDRSTGGLWGHGMERDRDGHGEPGPDHIRRGIIDLTSNTTSRSSSPPAEPLLGAKPPAGLRLGYISKLRKLSASRSTSGGSIIPIPSNHVSLTDGSYGNVYPARPNLSGPNENVPPSTHATRLSKSRTFNVISNLTQSLSRASLASLASSRNISGSSTRTGAAEAPNPTRLPRRSLTSRKSSSEAEPAPAVNPLLIREPQSSAYWSGRFTALHDRFHSELLFPSNLSVLIEAHNSRSAIQNESPSPAGAKSLAKSTSLYLRPSATTADIMHNHGRDDSRSTAEMDARLLLDDDNRCRRIFLHLEALCVTPKARRSLHLFQQDYARKHKRSALLPIGGSMEDQGFVARLFSGRRSLGPSAGNPQARLPLVNVHSKGKGGYVTIL